MAEEIKKVVKIDVAESSNSVKALREQVEKLRDVLKTLDSTSDEYKTVLGELKTAQDGLTSALKASQDQAKNGFKLNLGDSPKTVKGLKEEIKSLQDALLNITPGTDEYSQAIKRLVDDQTELNTVMNASKTVVGAAEGSYAQLSARMTALKRVWKATNDEATRTELGKEIKGINDELKRLDLSIGNAQRNVGNYAGSFQALRQELKDARDVMAGAAQGTAEYTAAAQKAAEASAKLRDMQEEIVKGDAGLDNKFAVTAGLLGNISGGFAAVQGAMALFGEESEDLQKTFVKLQAAMSMTQGLKALAELPKGLNAAKIAFGGAATGVRNFIKSLNLVKGAIAATGIGLLLVLLGELIANWDKVTEAVGNFVGGMDGLTEKLAGVGNVIKNLVTGPLKALGQALRGNFKEAADTIKNSFSIAANYAEGAARKAEENAEKATRKQAKETAEQLDYQIRMNEAKRGSDWKYTEEARKMYEQYFQNMLAQYDKNSKDYQEMLIKMEAYNREFNDHQKQEEERKAKEQEAARKAAYERAKAIAEKEKEMYENAAAAAGDAVLTEFGKRRKELQDRIKEFEPLITKAFGNPPFKELGESLVKEANATITAQEGIIREALERAGLSYEGLMEVLKKGPKEAIPLYAEAIKAGGLDVTKELYTVFDKSRAIITNLTESSWQEIEGVIELYSEKAQVSIKNNIINEGEWQLFIDAVRNIMIKALDDENKMIFELAKTYNMTFDEINEYHTQWAKNTEGVLIKQRDDTWKFTEEGRKFYEEYFDGLKVYYENDFDNWIKVLDEEAKYNQEYLKHNEQEKRESLQRTLADNLAIIDKYNTELERRSDFDFWSRMFGSSKAEVERGFKEYEAMVKELDELGGTGNIIIPADAGMERTKTLKEELGSVFTWIREESLKTYDEEIANNNAYLANFIQGINIQIEELNKELELETLTAEERKSIEAEIAAFKQQKAEETYRVYAENKDKEAQKAKKIEQVKKSLASSTADVFGGLSDYMSALSDKQAKTDKESARKSFEASKNLAIGETIIQTLATVQGIIKSFSGMGPWGVAAGVVAGAAALASGMARVQQIRNQEFESSSSSSGVNTVSAVAVPQLESTPYQYTQNVTNAEDEDKLNQPIIVQVSDVDDALKVRESRSVETSF